MSPLLRVPARLRSLLSPLMDARLPDVSLGIGEGYAAAAEVSTSAGGSALRSYFLIDLPPAGSGAAGAAPFGLSPEWSGRISSLRGRAGIGPQPVSLVVPDPAARVSILNVDSLPRRRRDIDAMIRWRLKKSLPFRVDDALMDFASWPPEGGERRHTLLVAVMRRKTVEQVESACAAAGFSVGMINLCTFALQSLFSGEIGRGLPPGSDLGLLNLGDRSFSFLILRGERPLFYRSKSLEHLAGEGADAIRRTAQSELLPTLQYYRDRLGGRGLACLYVRDAQPVAGDVSSPLEALASAPVVQLDPHAVIRIPEDMDPGPRALSRLAPVLGLALQSRA